MSLFCKKKVEEECPMDKFSTCYECNALFKTDMMKQVKVTDFSPYFGHNGIRYYCQKCKPPYEVVHIVNYEEVYYKTFQVNKNGEVIGAKVAKVKK